MLPKRPLALRIADTLEREARLVEREVRQAMLIDPHAPAKVVRPRAKLAVPPMPRWEGGTCASECCTDAVDPECRVHTGYTVSGWNRPV